MNIILETPRTYLRELTPNDSSYFYQLNLDEEVIKYTGDMPFASIEEAQKFLENYTHYKLHQYGRWAVIEKSSNSFIGWCGLRYINQTNETDIGFRFFKEYWNKGFATETAKAVIDYGFHTLQLRRIIGIVMKQNTASIQVLKKIGMQKIGTTTCDLHDAYLFEINHSNV